MITYLLGFVFQYGAIALLVVFAPELRAALAHLGQARFAGLFRQMEQREVAEEIAEAVERLSRSGIGAIVAIEREVPLDDYSESGSPMQAKVSADLLTTIFTPYSPLHDGAVLVRGDTIIAAGCILPLSQTSIDRPLARHAAPRRARAERGDRRARGRGERGARDDLGRGARAAVPRPDAGRACATCWRDARRSDAALPPAGVPA